MNRKSLVYLVGGLFVGGVVGISCQKSESVTPVPNLSAIAGFNAKAGNSIPLSKGQSWVANYRNSALAAQDGTVAYYFGNAAVDQIKNQPGCVGIRMYRAMEANGQQQLLLVGVDNTGHDMLPRTSADGQLVYTNGLVEDGAQKCPDVCDDTSPITSSVSDTTKSLL